MDPVDARTVAQLIDTNLGEAAESYGLGSTRYAVTLTHSTWPVIVTITAQNHHSGISLAIEQEPFLSRDPVVHAHAAVTLICANLDDEWRSRGVVR